MSDVENFEESVLLMLAEAAEDSTSQLGLGDMAARMRPPAPFRRVEIVADHLVSIGHAKPIEYDHAMTDYRITQKGLKWVEKHFERQDDTFGNTTWRRLPDTETRVEDRRLTSEGVHIHNNFTPQNNFQPINNQNIPSSRDVASMWGAWGTWLGVIVAVLAIFVTIYVAGK